MTRFELGAGDLPALQRLFESNPAYFEVVHGEAPGPEAARHTFERLPPADMTFTRKWVLGWHDSGGELVAMSDVIQDLMARDVWHVGLFMVAGAHHGRGVAQACYADLEAWMAGCGARWSRLGAVEGNVRAERFWRAQGYTEVRRRHGVEMGRRTHVLLVMAKPLAGGALDEYLALVARDRPE